MDTVTVSKAELIEKLTANRDEHVALFTEASGNYRQKVVDALRERAEKIENGDDITTYFDLPKPEDHSQDYNDALEALVWEQSDEVELARHGEFREWVLNKWSWDRAFIANTMSYTQAGSLRR